MYFPTKHQNALIQNLNIEHCNKLLLEWQFYLSWTDGALQNTYLIF